MLEVVELKSSIQKKEFFKHFNPQAQTWIVSDLHSKLSIQNNLLSERDYLEDHSVLRISELWKDISRQLCPEYRTISKDLMIIILQKKLNNKEQEWLRRPGTASVVCEYMGQFLSIINHSNGMEIVSEWFSENPNAQTRWSGWLYLCNEIWLELKKEKILLTNWLSGLLLDAEGIEEYRWDKEILFDVGAELTSIEVELIKKISNKQSIKVTLLSPKWHEDYQSTLHPYELLKESAKIIIKNAEPVKDENQSCQSQEIFEEKESVSVNKQFLKFTTMAAEVKNSVAVIRQWLDSGVEAKDISVVAPNIEVYWLILQMHLEAEGVPFSKKTLLRAHSLPIIGLWLSNIRLSSNSVKSSDLEVSYFSRLASNDDSNQSGKMSFEEFEKLYKVIYEKADLKRSKKLEELYGVYSSEEKNKEDRFDENKVINIESFILWSLRFWPGGNENFDVFELIIEKIFTETPGSICLTKASWLDFLQSLVSRIEIEQDVEFQSSSEGIICVNLMSSGHLKNKYRILMGVDEASLKVSSSRGVPAMDAKMLGEQTGFYLPVIDHDKLEFECNVFLKENVKELIVSCAETDFSGAALAPSLLWVQGSIDSNQEEKVLSVPKITRWDEIQETPEEFSVDRFEELINPIAEPFFVGETESISATMIERYMECPFRFSAEKVFGLSDLPSLDLDVDHMTRGTLMHALFERLIDINGDILLFGNDNIEDELLDIIDNVRVEKKILLADERLWKPLKKKYLTLCLNFLDFEKKWRMKFPKTKTIGRELKINGYIDIEEGDFLSEASKQDTNNKVFKFRGSIDRVDTDDNENIVVIDYKSSQNGLKQFTSQLTALKVQLALYTMAFEAGLTKDNSLLQDDSLSKTGKEEVIAGLYYVSKKSDREIGFKLEEKEGSLYDFESKKRNKITFEQKQQVLSSVKEKVKDTLQAVYSGDFYPRPDKTDTCKKCKWSRLCRAPHLN